jgi:c-di-GMP-binding flagellar brake protein YcgR
MFAASLNGKIAAAYARGESQVKSSLAGPVPPSQPGAKAGEPHVHLSSAGAQVANSTFDEDDAEQYRISNRVEIISILRALATDKILATVYYEGREKFLLTRILAVNPSFGEVIFDSGPDARVNMAMRQAPELDVHALHNQIKIQFDAQLAEPTLFENRPAFRVPLPASLIRLQRRADFRAKTPALAVATLSISLEEADEPLQVRVADISCGGVAFVVPNGRAHFDPGTVIGNCILDMPRVGKLDVVLEIRHNSDYKDGMGRSMRRFGCKFLNMTGAAETLVQRYIHLIERERRSSALGS